MSPAKLARKTLLLLGTKGAKERVRVLEDTKAGEVVVQYKDGRAIPRRKTFPNTGQGKKDAREWAKAYHAERAKGSVPTKTTHMQLWKQFSESQAFTSRRAKTQINYRDRWRAWMHYRGERTVVDDTTLGHVDQFIAARKAAGKSPNQTRSIIAVARIVYNWGQTRKLIATNELALFRWQTAEGEEAFEPEEYTEAEFLALLEELPAQSHRTWRSHVALMLAGHQGVRANAVLHLRWSDVRLSAGQFAWPAKYQKNRRELVQPMTWDAVAALETARYWRERWGYEGDWVLFGSKSGAQAKPDEVHGNSKSGRHEKDLSYTYQALWTQLKAAEGRAQVEHKPRRALHGFRKMVAGNVHDRTGDDRLAMQFIGDRDMKQARRYLKNRDERMERAAAALETKAPERKAKAATATVPQVSETTSAPSGAQGTHSHD